MWFVALGFREGGGLGWFTFVRRDDRRVSRQARKDLLELHLDEIRYSNMVSSEIRST